jgi:hypothetical protein
MTHHYRPTPVGLVIAIMALYIASLAYRWTLDGAIGDGAGAVVVAVLLGWVAWRLDTRVVVVSSG